MKKSNIFIISGVILLVGWLLLGDWLQVNAFNIIKSGRKCSYAKVDFNNSIKQLPPFKNIKIDFDKNLELPKIVIHSAKSQELSFSKSVNGASSMSVSGDTLYLRINYANWGNEDNINIGIPELNSVILSSANNYERGTQSFDTNHDISISGFKANTLFIYNNCSYFLNIEENKLKKLELKGDSLSGRMKISNYTDYDSLDIDIQGGQGKLILNGYSDGKNNPKQWIGIKVPGNFHIEAPADVLLVSKITK
jgi:hypothetical protein